MAKIRLVNPPGTEAIYASYKFSQAVVAEGRVDVLAAWSLVHGLAELMIAGRLGFMKHDLEADLQGAIMKAIERVVPAGERS